MIKTEFGTPLLDAKNLVDKAPIAIKENITPEEAESLKQKFEDTYQAVQNELDDDIPF